LHRGEGDENVAHFHLGSVLIAGAGVALGGCDAAVLAGGNADAGELTGNGGRASSSGGAAAAGGMVNDAGGVTSTGGTGGAAGAGDTGGAAGAGNTGGAAGAGDTGGAASAGDTGGAPSSGGSSATGGSGPNPPGKCLEGITDYGKAGPFQFTQRTVGRVKFWVPGVPAGCKVPVIHLANGTGASCSAYAASLERMATHGFLAACYEDTNTGEGNQGLEAIATALSAFPDLADHRFGSTGHSAGGQAAFIVVALAEKKYGEKGVYAGLAMEPESGFGAQPTGSTWQKTYDAIRSPMFMFSGLGTDGLVSQSLVQTAFDALNEATEAYFWTCEGAKHIPVPNGEGMQISIPWFRWKLLGDKKACTFFKDIPKTDTRWDQVGVQNAQACE
jgi:hypothetical protein